MKFKLQHNSLNLSNKFSPKSSLNILFSFNKQLLPNSKKYNPSIMLNPLNDLKSAGSYSFCYNDTPCLTVSHGDKKLFNASEYLTSLKTIVKFITTNIQINSVNLILEGEIAKLLQQTFSEHVEYTAFQLLNYLYYFDEFKTKKHQLLLTEINFVTPSDETPALENSCSMASGVILLKNLANRPSNAATPEHLAHEARAIAKLSKKVKVEVLEEKDIKKLKMNSFLAVAQGSQAPAKFIIMEYNGGTNTEKPIVLIGKGITFDTGGVSIKPKMFLEDMKYDMTGAATVIGTFLTTVRLGLKLNLVVLVPSCENVLSANAVKPGDIVKSMSGKTIEIINTDAEGRLILCDALTYASKYKPKFVIDVATLTGAIMTALGTAASGLFANDNSLANSLLDSGTKTNDRLWQMPLFKDYHKALESSIADLKNIAAWNGYAGSCIAAAFLENFVNYKWAHLDIAGTAHAGGFYDGSHANGGATGSAFYLLIDFLKKNSH